MKFYDFENSWGLQKEFLLAACDPDLDRSFTFDFYPKNC